MTPLSSAFEEFYISQMDSPKIVVEAEGFTGF
jgi:hypothetical protein